MNMDDVFHRSMPRQQDEVDANLSPEAMRDNRPRTFGNGENPAVNRVTFLPVLQQPQAAEDEEERERRPAWLSPMDFLDDEDLFGRDGNPDDLERTRDEDDPVIFDWQGLGEQLSEQELRMAEDENATTNGEGEGERERAAIRSLRDRDLRSLALEPVQMGTSGNDANQDRTLRTNQGGGNNNQPAAGTIASRMDSAMRMGGPPARVERDDDADLPEINLTGTRAVMEESTSRWNTSNASSPPTSSGFRDSTAPSVSSSAVSARWDSPRPERPEPVRPIGNTPSMGSSIRMEPIRPTSPMPSAVNRPTRDTAPAQRETIDRSHFRDDEFRLRPRSDRF
ncbi:MAG: hypothetical protein LAT83_06880 [Kiritimatiellae bacterium]|nr:hypothetical protein [Kiritimatiellia bacterium]